MKRITKGAIPAIAVSGGVAALLFGGSPVSTAFTSQSNYKGTVAGASVNGSVTNGNFSVGDLTPGGPAQMVSISFNNTGTTTEEAYVQVQNLMINRNGTGGSPNPADLQFTLLLPTGSCSGTTPSSPFVYYNGVGTDAALTAPSGESLCTYSYSDISAMSGQWLDVATIRGAKSISDTVYVGLASDAGNSWNGAIASVPYTVQFQDTSGVNDGALPTAGSVHNLNGAQQIDSDHYVAPTNG
ncbi:MAG: hypothetical protein KGQ66_23240 [Acidobacteriota bacterium]|nr:hypothetical protein [Acidobacteriota bacterium]